ncbi:MAG: Two-component response regulator SA14-24, partial [uncultured Solirubrobacteraceae bacterium]
ERRAGAPRRVAPYAWRRGQSDDGVRWRRSPGLRRGHRPHGGGRFRQRLRPRARQAHRGRRLAPARARQPRAARRDGGDAAQCDRHRPGGPRAGRLVLPPAALRSPAVAGRGGLLGAVHRRPARPRAAARRRRLDRQAVPPGRGARAPRGGPAPSQALGAGRPERLRADRRGGDPPRSVPGLRRRGERRPHAPRVRADPAARRRRGPGARARGHLPARLGLRDGPRRSLGRRLRAQAAPEARAHLTAVALHPHALRDRLPLRSRVARRGAGGPGAHSGPGRRVRVRVGGRADLRGHARL